MLRYKHLFSEPVGVQHWDLRNNSQYNLVFEVKDKQNRAGFISFQVSKEDENKIKCILFVKDDKAALDNIEKELSQAIVDNSGFFQSFKLAKLIQKESAGCGYMLSTQDPKVMEIMVYYVDRKLQFTNNHYETIKNMTAISQSNEIEQSGYKCALV